MPPMELGRALPEPVAEAGAGASGAGGEGATRDEPGDIGGLGIGGTGGSGSNSDGLDYGIRTVPHPEGSGRGLGTR